MLQQTQVATATPFYQAFLDRFPNLDALARAPIDAVLHAWAGLGYYRRARMLHAAAREIVREHGGLVPRDPAAFGALPGVGRYTTGAVLSIAYERPLAVVDGNVARVLSRIEALPLALKRPRDARVLWARAESLVPADAPGDWNQALMELGATVCTPRMPRCEMCPVHRWCRALALKRVEAFPPVAARRDTERVRRAVILITREDRMLMARREGALLAGLWEPPGAELAGGGSARAPLGRALAALGFRAKLEPTGEVVRHTITHRRIEVEVWRGMMVGRTAGIPTRARWVSFQTPEVALTALARKLARLAGVAPARATHPDARRASHTPGISRASSGNGRSRNRRTRTRTRPAPATGATARASRRLSGSRPA
jgi:A/G-specific adenine glycosylase